MRTVTVRSLVVSSMFVVSTVLCDLARAGGVGISEVRDSVGVTATSPPTGVPVPFHLYKARLDRSPKARRDFDFFWSDTYKSRFRMPLDSLSGAEQINDLQRLAETVGEVIGSNPFILPWTDVQVAYNILSRAEGYRAALYNDSPVNTTGLKVAQLSRHRAQSHRRLHLRAELRGIQPVADVRRRPEDPGPIRRRIQHRAVPFGVQFHGRGQSDPRGRAASKQLGDDPRAATQWCGLDRSNTLDPTGRNRECLSDPREHTCGQQR